VKIDQIAITQDALDRLDGIALLTGLDGSILDANPAALECYGRSLAEMVGLSIHDIRAPGVQDDIDRQMRRAVEHGAVYESLHHRGDGSQFPVEVRSIPAIIDGKPALLSLVHDITERKQAEQELGESESRYRALAVSSPLAVFVSRNERGDDRVALANPACVKLFEASSAEDLIGTSALELFEPDSRALVRERVDQASAAVLLVEARILRLDGTPLDVEITISPLPDQGVAAVEVVLHDITERRQADEELRQSEQKFAAAFHASPNLIAITALSDGEILEVNEAFSALLGYTRAESIGKTTAELSIWTDLADRAEFTRLLAEAGEVQDLETTLRRKDGTLVSVTDSARTLDFQGEKCVLSITHDVTERKRALEELEFRNAVLSTVQETSKDGILVVDEAEHVLSFNRRFVEMWHIPEELIEDGADEPLLQFAASQLTDSQPFLQRARHLNEHRRETSQDELVLADGRVFDHYSAPMLGPGERYFGHVWYFRDITEGKRAEQELVGQKDQIGRTLTSVIDIASNITEMRDPYTAGHQRRVSELAVRISEEMGMSVQQIEENRVAALIHDVGKMSVPAEILVKPGVLSPMEFSLVKSHAEAGYRIIASANMQGRIDEIVYQHHERCDGSGYPRGLSAEQLLPGAKVLMVADVVEAMASHRPYRAALGIDTALAEIERGAGTLYDAEVSKACMTVFRELGFTFSES